MSHSIEKFQSEEYEEFDDLLGDLDGCMQSTGHLDGEMEEIPQLPQEGIENLYALAYQLYEQQRYQEAGKIFRLLMLVDQEDVRHWIGLAACCQQNKQYHEAMVLYTLAAKLDSENPYIPLHMAECLFATKKREQGLEALHFAEALVSNNKEYGSVKQEIDLLQAAWGSDS